MVLSSQLRQITCWFSSPRTITYVIPTYTSLESCLGANLEIELNLPVSYNYHEAYKSIIKEKGRLLPVPKHQTPEMIMDFSSKKSHHKTYFTITEKEELR